MDSFNAENAELGFPARLAVEAMLDVRIAMENRVVRADVPTRSTCTPDMKATKPRGSRKHGTDVSVCAKKAERSSPLACETSAVERSRHTKSKEPSLENGVVSTMSFQALDKRSSDRSTSLKRLPPSSSEGRAKAAQSKAMVSEPVDHGLDDDEFVFFEADIFARGDDKF